jgi:hypothetical protein
VKRGALVLALGGALLASRPAHAYDQAVHVAVSQKDFPKWNLPVPQPPAPQASALRHQIWVLLTGDPARAARVGARWPSEDRFDAWELKRLLALNPDRSIAGLDDAAPLATGATALEVYAQASRLPDDDKRNQERFRHDAERKVTLDPFGQPLPEDPATLEMGSLRGLSSQAHAHYGLPKLQFSDDPEVLKKDPRRFAYPPTAHTFGSEFVETYTALALLAARVPAASDDERNRLILTHAGAAAHHLEDVANQIHTVQVGLYDFFFDAKIQAIKEDLLSLGGLLWSRPDFLELGLDFITNHHILTESLFAKHLLAPGDPVAQRFARGEPADEEFARSVAAVGEQCKPGFGAELSDTLVERSSHEGPEVYRLIRELGGPRWSRAGAHYHEEDDPDLAIRPGVDPSRFFDLELRGIARCGPVLAAWWRGLARCRAGGVEQADAYLTRWLDARLDALDAIDARSKAYQPKPPARHTINYWIPIGFVIVLLMIALLVRLVLRRRGSK